MTVNELDWLVDQGIVDPCPSCDGYHPSYRRLMDLSSVDSTLDEMRYPSRDY